MTRTWPKASLGVLLALLAWEVTGRSIHAVRDVIASPTLILAQYWTGADLYVPHLLATVRSAAFGFVIGTSCALAAAIFFCRSSMAPMSHGQKNFMTAQATRKNTTPWMTSVSAKFISYSPPSARSALTT